MNQKLTKFFLLFIVLAVSAGCAYIDATTPQLNEAKQILGEAWIKGANVKAPYEYSSASYYLEIACAEKCENDYPAAREFGNIALERAKKALELSK